MCKRTRKIHNKKIIKEIFVVDNVDKNLAKHIFPDFYYISGTHSYQQITRFTSVDKKIFYFFKGFEKICFMPVFGHYFSYIIRGNIMMSERSRLKL